MELEGGLDDGVDDGVRYASWIQYYKEAHDQMESAQEGTGSRWVKAALGSMLVRLGGAPPPDLIDNELVEPPRLSHLKLGEPQLNSAPSVKNEVSATEQTAPVKDKSSTEKVVEGEAAATGKMEAAVKNQTAVEAGQANDASLRHEGQQGENADTLMRRANGAYHKLHKTSPVLEMRKVDIVALEGGDYQMFLELEAKALPARSLAYLSHSCSSPRGVGDSWCHLYSSLPLMSLVPFDPRRMNSGGSRKRHG